MGRYSNQSTVDIEHENNKLRLELFSAVRWIKLREHWWAKGVHGLQTAAGHEFQSLDLVRREGELELTQRLSAMENIAVQADHLRALEAAVRNPSEQDVRARLRFATVCRCES